MKLLKIVLIVILLIVMCSAISLGTGTITSSDKTVDLAELKDAGAITSGDKTVTMAEIKEMYEAKEEKSILNDWFKNLPITEKMKLYTYWHGLNNYHSEFDDRLETLEQNSESWGKFIYWFRWRIDDIEAWIKEIRKSMGDELPNLIPPSPGGTDGIIYKDGYDYVPTYLINNYKGGE